MGQKIDGSNYTATDFVVHKHHATDFHLTFKI